MVKTMSFFVKGLYFPKPQMKMSTKVNFLFGGFLFSSHLTTTIPASITCFNFLQAFFFWEEKGGHFFQSTYNSLEIVFVFFLPTKKYYYSFLTFVMFVRIPTQLSQLITNANWIRHSSFNLIQILFKTSAARQHYYHQSRQYFFEMNSTKY